MPRVPTSVVLSIVAATAFLAAVAAFLGQYLILAVAVVGLLAILRWYFGMG